jgi:hypothetical protein
MVDNRKCRMNSTLFDQPQSTRHRQNEIVAACDTTETHPLQFPVCDVGQSGFSIYSVCVADDGRTQITMEPSAQILTSLDAKHGLQGLQHAYYPYSIQLSRAAKPASAV